jgi:uncharacterized membrane protein YfcA
MDGRSDERALRQLKHGFQSAALSGTVAARTVHRPKPIGAPVDALPSLAAIAGIFLLAGFTKGVIGLGLPTVGIGLLGLLMAPAQAAAILVVPSLVTNVWQSVVGPGLLHLLRRLWPMFAGVCLGTWASAGILTGSNSGWASAALGVALVAYAAFGLSKVHFSVPPRSEIWLSPLIGLATGVVTGATGIFTMPAVPYLQALGLDKDDLVQALGLSFTVSTAALGAALMGASALQLSEAWISLLALLAALVGMALGQMLRGRVRPETFRFIFFAGLLLLGAHLALRGLL